ncbi:hypothetical protein [Streptomyces boninensis]|uniref:hypothetical protein n=1 Tax=Streptomyces boninensis TaxID=2039455 RepID=UPI003B22769F
MISRRTARLAALAVLPTALVLGGPVGSGVAADDDSARQIDLLPQNDSGAKGAAFLSLKGTELTVYVDVKGLVPNAPHAQHIHGSTKGMNFHCPTADADKNGDGIVSTAEGLPSYGDIMISLTTKGDTSKDSGLAVERMPKADADGNLSYKRTITVSQKVADHIKDLHLVQHGIDVNNNGKYDAGAGKSELDPKLPQEATAPANCGMVKGAAIGSMPVGAVETGGGQDPDATAPGLIAAGGIGLAGAAGLLLLARRRRGTQW